ncbi:IS3 family transposase [Candidatus Poriferisodalis sp.]|uniref:IS3 family transposase n=1 Tax=Candidatus Poriferisodalis sp. TaxID=3101277 RepID=UPI003AF8CA07
MTTMKRKRHTPEQAVRKLREGEKRLNAGEDLGLVLRHLEITESTWNRWRSTYGGMKAADVKELKELRVENARLKTLLAEAEPGQGDAQGPRGGKMVTPDRRRAAVVRLQERFGVSQRRACAVVGQHRSTQRPAPAARADADAAYGEWLCRFAQSHPRWGWRKAHDVAAREGLAVNPKRTLRLWRAHRVQRPPQRRHKRQRLGDGTAAKLRAEHPNHVWALDFQFDETAARRRLKLLNIIDEFTREALAIHVGHSIDADGAVEVVSEIAARRGAPTHLRMDNGPELTADALRDWCRHTCTDTACIARHPWENGWIESFNGRLRDECLNIEDFANLLEARVVLEDWRHDYNHHRPHRSLGGQTPAAYAANHQPTTTTTKHP